MVSMLNIDGKYVEQGQGQGQGQGQHCSTYLPLMFNILTIVQHTYHFQCLRPHFPWNPAPISRGIQHFLG